MIQRVLVTVIFNACPLLTLNVPFHGCYQSLIGIYDVCYALDASCRSA